MHVVVSFDYQKESMRGIFQDFVSWRVETPLAYSKKLSIAHHSKSETQSSQFGTAFWCNPLLNIMAEDSMDRCFY